MATPFEAPLSPRARPPGPSCSAACLDSLCSRTFVEASLRPICHGFPGTEGPLCVPVGACAAFAEALPGGSPSGFRRADRYPLIHVLDRGNGPLSGNPDVDIRGDPLPPRRPRPDARRVMDGDMLRHPRFRLGAVIAVALAAGLVAWLVLRDDGGSSATRPTRPSAPR